MSRPGRLGVLGLSIFCILMSGLQWFVGTARGARDIAYDLRRGEHHAAGTTLLRLANSKSLRMIDVTWQLYVNYPRNWLLTKASIYSFPEQADIFAANHPLLWQDFMNSFILIIGSVAIYGPVVVLVTRRFHRMRPAGDGAHSEGDS